MVRQASLFSRVEVFGKLNGAVGNFNAHLAAYPDADWPDISARFVGSLDLSPASYTTQIEPHDWIAEYADALRRFNTVLIDFAEEVGVAADPDALINMVAGKLLAGNISDTLRGEIAGMLALVPEDQALLRAAETIYLVATSPEFAYQR